MRSWRLGMLVVGVAAGASVFGGLACSAPEPTHTTRRAGSSTGTPTKGKGTSDASTAADDDDEAPRSDDASTTDPPPAPPDADGDGVPDADDCDPASAALGARLLDDTLATDKGFFATADGFPQTSWSYEATAYRQTRLADAADAAFFVKDAAIGDVLVDVRAASTEVGAITPRLRQIFVLVGATVTGGQLAAIGCGVEVVQGEATEQKTSVVRLAGAPGAVATTSLSRVNRAALQANEEFTIKARLAQGTLTCDVTNGGVTTTASASGLGTPKGSVGFFTRQTKALFKQARICRLK